MSSLGNGMNVKIIRFSILLIAGSYFKMMISLTGLSQLKKTLAVKMCESFRKEVDKLNKKKESSNSVALMMEKKKSINLRRSVLKRSVDVFLLPANSFFL